MRGEIITGRDGVSLEESVGRLLRERGWTIAVAESCTGGLISQRLTSISGSSDYFDRGLVTYSNRAKMELLGVPAETLESFGAVSRETALAMAAGVRERSRTDIGLSSTGIAGPTGGSPEKPVGTVWIGLSGPDGDDAELFRFPGQRSQVTMQAAEAALSRLHRYLVRRT